MKRFNIDLAAKTETLISKSFLRLYKQNMMLEYVEMKSDAFKKTQKINSYVIQMVLINDIEMILLWIFLIIEINTGRNLTNQIPQ